MAISAVMTVDLFNGMNTHVWTGWIFFAVALGIVLIWAYTVSAYHVIIEFNLTIFFRLFIPLSPLHGLPSRSTGTITTSSTRRISGSQLCSSSPWLCFRGTSTRRTSSRITPRTWTWPDGSVSRTPATTSRRTRMVLSLAFSALRAARRSRGTVCKSGQQRSTQAAQTWPPASAPSTAASASRQKKAA